MAYTDTVTGLYNRVYYVEKINDLERNISSYQSLCCIVIDINDFKSVNDRFGHHIGDETLRQVSQTIQEAFNDTTPMSFVSEATNFSSFLSMFRKLLLKKAGGIGFPHATSSCPGRIFRKSRFRI
ncbi:MAG: GGDEF domain-containing protein [Christensenellaceae bacterium]